MENDLSSFDMLVNTVNFIYVVKQTNTHTTKPVREPTFYAKRKKVILKNTR